MSKSTQQKKVSAADLNRLRLLFDKYKTEDDKIHLEGLTKLLNDEGSTDPAHAARELLEYLDADHDKMVSYKEFLKAYVQVSDDVDHFIESILTTQTHHNVDFVFNSAANVHEVKLAGPWNKWAGESMFAGPNHTFSLTVKLPEGRVHYKCIFADVLKIGNEWKWEVDAGKPTERDPSGNLNNWLDVKKNTFE